MYMIAVSISLVVLLHWALVSNDVKSREDTSANTISAPALYRSSIKSEDLEINLTFSREHLDLISAQDACGKGRCMVCFIP